jgi:3-carboxy-cis,cis-muconate cycloisomerase
MNRSSSSSDPFRFLTAAGPVAALTSARAWIDAVLEVEAALAGAQADTGEIPLGAAGGIARACDVARFDVDAIVEEAGLGGNLVIPLLPRLREIVGPDDAGYVHRGATSQDVMDAATALVGRRCADAVTTSLGRARRTVAGLASAYGTAPMIARTLGQHAVPTTFATVTDRWSDGLAAAVEALDRVARPAVGLGGPSGDGTSFGTGHGAVVAQFAARLDLPVAPIARHGQRTWIADIAGAWGVAAAASGKLATDVVVLAQSDVGEVEELADGAGGSSSMPHKRNPIAAISARAAAMQAPGLVATVMGAAGAGELERAAGAWHAEWPALRQLWQATGSAVHWVGASLGRLHVDTDRMALNLARAEAALT